MSRCAGFYMCADFVTAKQADGIRRVLESCCLPAHMPVMLKVFMTHPDLNFVLSRFLKFGRYENDALFVGSYMWIHDSIICLLG